MTHFGASAQEGDTSPPKRGQIHAKLVLEEANMEDKLLGIATNFQQALDTSLAKFQTRWLSPYLNFPTISIWWNMIILPIEKGIWPYRHLN